MSRPAASHWLTFDEISVAIAAVPFPRAAKRIAMMNSGASEASGASHWTSRNRSMPSSVPAETKLSANGLAHSRITAPDARKRLTTTMRRRRSGSSPRAAAVPIRSGSSTSPWLTL